MGIVRPDSRPVLTAGDSAISTGHRGKTAPVDGVWKPGTTRWACLITTACCVYLAVSPPLAITVHTEKGWVVFTIFMIGAAGQTATAWLIRRKAPARHRATQALTPATAHDHGNSPGPRRVTEAGLLDRPMPAAPPHRPGRRRLQRHLFTEAGQHPAVLRFPLRSRPARTRIPFTAAAPTLPAALCCRTLPKNDHSGDRHHAGPATTAAVPAPPAIRPARRTGTGTTKLTGRDTQRWCPE